VTSVPTPGKMTSNSFQNCAATCTMAPVFKRMERSHSPSRAEMWSLPWLPTEPIMSVCRGGRARAYAMPFSPKQVPCAPSEEKKLQLACSRNCCKVIQVAWLSRAVKLRRRPSSFDGGKDLGPTTMSLPARNVSCSCRRLGRGCRSRIGNRGIG
jgi:hypothetical protein